MVLIFASSTRSIGLSKIIVILASGATPAVVESGSKSYLIMSGGSLSFSNILLLHCGPIAMPDEPKTRFGLARIRIDSAPLEGSIDKLNISMLSPGKGVVVPFVIKLIAGDKLDGLVSILKCAIDTPC